jgi:Fe2+ or Zn2+ uptake regulation protein
MVKRRKTPIQQEIRDMLEQSDAALNHAEIEARLTVAADRATIFRVVNRMVEDGLAHKIMSDDGVTYFASCHGSCGGGAHHDEHAHFKCIRCNTLSCLSDQLVPKLPANYKMLSANVVIMGICPSCAVA